MKNQNNQRRQSSLPTAILTIVMMLLVSLGCSDFTKGFKEGYDKGRGATTSSNSSTSSSGGDTAAKPKLAEDIVGRWEMTGNGKTLDFNFSSDKTVESFVDGKVLSSGTYHVIDEKTIETRNTSGSVTETIPIKIEGDKMTMTYNNTNLILTKK
ncbi:MAG: hypothetical protein ACR2GD_04600 [Pyrinomonadaceae bacterium]